ncbi:MAG: hypothetical protein ACHQHN_10170 [Sphingobacteriales bacterium]
MTDLTQQNRNLSEDDYTAGIDATIEYDFTKPAKTEFKPWHKPRKQYVRNKQWVHLINELLSAHFPEDKTFKYLSLPGDDLLDLRWLHEKVCVPKKVKIKYLGFNKGEKPGPEHDAKLEISRSEINSLPYVDGQSKLLPDDIIQISGGEKSIAFDESKEMAPFDIINIDLCDSIAGEAVDEFKENHYKTLNTLMTLQSYRKDPWLLLLTTRTNKGKVNNDVFKVLKKVYLENLKSCKGFMQKSSTITSVDGEEALENYCLKEDGFTNVFLIGLSKWIQGLGVSQTPQKEVEIKSIMGYRVWSKATSPDMISIALQINPTNTLAFDKMGLSSQNSPKVDECDKAIKMLEQLALQINVDEVLTDDGLRDLMKSETIALLKQARYNVEGYDDFLVKYSQQMSVGAVAQPNSKTVEAIEQAIALKKVDEIYSEKKILPGPKIIGKIDLTNFEKFRKKK